MTPENLDIPDWARRERQADLDWIADNLAVFWTSATLGLEDTGRGAIIVDTTIQPAPDAGHPFVYFSQEQVEEAANVDTKRIVAEYDPGHEFVVVLLKPADRISTYRVRALDNDAELYEQRITEQRLAEQEKETGPKLDPPDIETLIYWEAEGGCEAACPHHCWVEPDGTCQHDNPSWLLKLGLI